VGGKNKGFEQIKNQKNSYLALDNIEVDINKKNSTLAVWFLILATECYFIERE
jgi:hypothetical protein